MRIKSKTAIPIVALFFSCLSEPGIMLAQKSALSGRPAEAEALTRGSTSRTITSKADPRKPNEKWIPEDIDRVVPPVKSGVACSLPAVLEGAGQKIVEFVQNVDRFTATEVLLHRPVDRSGRLGRPVTLKFDYLVSMATGRGGLLQVDELRNRSHSLEQFPSHIATTGTPSLVLIFHPRYIGNFRMKCEGLGEWRGQPAWQVRFEQRADRSNYTLAFFVNNLKYDASLRGRAWILADSFQVARMETDLAESIPKIRLRLNHESVEYRPVISPRNKQELWLPFSAELYMDFQGHRFYRKHAFTNFKIFSVDTQIQIDDPKEILAIQ
jgi:hypothetical protein